MRLLRAERLKVDTLSSYKLKKELLKTDKLGGNIKTIKEDSYK
jgi:hypothetical protein